MCYKKRFIRNDFATSRNSWKNKKPPLVFFKILRNATFKCTSCNFFAKKRPLGFFKILRNATFKCTSENFFAKQRLAKHYAKSLKKYTISHCTVINDLLRLKFSWSTQLLSLTSLKETKKISVFFRENNWKKKSRKNKKRPCKFLHFLSNDHQKMGHF